MSPIDKPRAISESIDTIGFWVIEDDARLRELFCEELGESPDFACNGSFGSVEEALKAADDEYVPEVVLMDIGLPGMNGIEGTKRILEISPATDVLILTQYEEEDKIVAAIGAGAKGYLLKDSSVEERIHAIKEILDGGLPMSPRIMRKAVAMFAASLARPKKSYGITKREKEVIRLIMEGMSKRTIAEKLFLSYYTIDTHVKNIHSKLGVRTNPEVIAVVMREKLLD